MKRKLAQDHPKHSVLDLIGAFSSDKPLIDDIPVSEYPDLYLVAEALGGRAQAAHRYRRGENDRPVRDRT